MGDVTTGSTVLPVVLVHVVAYIVCTMYVEYRIVLSLDDTVDRRCEAYVDVRRMTCIVQY